MALLGRRHHHGDIVEIGGLAARLNINPRARRIFIKIDRLRRQAIIVAPSQRRLADAVAFARHRAPWMAERLAELPPARRLAAGDGISLFGRACRLDPDGRRPRLRPSEDGALSLRGCGEGEVDLQLVARAFKAEARKVFTERIGRHCAALGLTSAPRLLLTDTRTRWGSCAPARPGRPAAIRLSWRLAMAPFEVADYVAAHECAHLVELNHGPRFWTTVRGLVGDERSARVWLRENGPSLHALS